MSCSSQKLSNFYSFESSRCSCFQYISLKLNIFSTMTYESSNRWADNHELYVFDRVFYLHILFPCTLHQMNISFFFPVLLFFIKLLHFINMMMMMMMMMMATSLSPLFLHIRIWCSIVHDKFFVQHFHIRAE
jgi:hypothetical protein